MKSDFDERLNAIAWQDYCTAYGPATKVPEQLRQLAGSDLKRALDAAHELWCGLCHQHVQIGSAALPALPFLLDTLDAGDPRLTVELLDILLGLAIGVNRQRAVDFQRAIGRAAVAPELPWVTSLRTALLAQLPRFRELMESSDQAAADFAERIVAELGAGTAGR